MRDSADEQALSRDIEQVVGGDFEVIRLADAGVATHPKGLMTGMPMNQVATWFVRETGPADVQPVQDGQPVVLGDVAVTGPLRPDGDGHADLSDDVMSYVCALVEHWRTGE